MKEETGPGDGEGGLRAFLDGGAFERAAGELRRRLRDDPSDVRTLRDLAQVLRQSGDLAGASRAFRRVVDLDPSDLHAARLHALLEGIPPAPPDPVPVRFHRRRGFLGEERLGRLRDFVRGRRAAFEATAVRTADGRQDHDAGTRRSASLKEVDEVREWFDPLLAEEIPEAIRALSLGEFAVDVLSCKVTSWHDGCFFRLHQDEATGAAATRRAGFLYYFDFPPRRFTGGELLLYDRDPDTLWPLPSFTNLPPETDTLVFIPANAWHEVLPVRCPDPDWSAARFTFSGWLHDADLLDALEEGGGGGGM